MTDNYAAMIVNELRALNAHLLNILAVLNRLAERPSVPPESQKPR